MLVVYLIVRNGQGENQKTYWNRAGAAFENRDGSINVKLDMFPQLTLQIRQSKDDNAED